jgi:hypothetical protein
MDAFHSVDLKYVKITMKLVLSCSHSKGYKFLRQSYADSALKHHMINILTTRHYSVTTQHFSLQLDHNPQPAQVPHRYYLQNTHLESIKSLLALGSARPLTETG